MPFTFFEEQRAPRNSQRLSCFSCYELPDMLFHNIICNIHSLAICTNPKGKKRLFHVDGIIQAAIFLYYVYKDSGTSTDNFSV